MRIPLQPLGDVYKHRVFIVVELRMMQHFRSCVESGKQEEQTNRGTVRGICLILTGGEQNGLIEMRDDSLNAERKRRNQAIDMFAYTELRDRVDVEQVCRPRRASEKRDLALREAYSDTRQKVRNDLKDPYNQPKLCILAEVLGNTNAINGTSR
ncbi:hypothetical protein AJ78_03917 [Emergomyces pasteurianus Ep9510]|uniref:Uncharacterized protein n=1 Tax=Emergomyces pasteurianus Ep9510 TaxID=1447872 RepID=A0A1J9PHF2_9EURO|nr:hypothetical protein AJ78_03917 [Emergomyces pasteurianus Ep9510]